MTECGQTFWPREERCLLNDGGPGGRGADKVVPPRLKKALWPRCARGHNREDGQLGQVRPSTGVDTGDGGGGVVARMSGVAGALMPQAPSAVE